MEKLYGSADVLRQQAKLAVCEPHPVWFGEWNDYVRKECLARVFTKEITPKECVRLMAEKWNALRKG